MFGNIGELLKMQKQMKEIQKKIKKAEHEGKSPDGLVKVRVSGEFAVVSLSIDDELVKGGDCRKIEKSVTLAVNDAVAKGKDFAANEMKAMTGGMNIPGISDLF